MSEHSRTHNSKKSLNCERVLRSKYVQKIDSKPSGFWYGVNGDWLEWCASEMPHWIGNFNYEVDLTQANVLYISSREQLLQFDRKYGVTRPLLMREIDWQKVAGDYDGIEIAPYQSSLRHNRDVFWYYGWDVASGCLWNLKNIKLNELKTIA